MRATMRERIASEVRVVGIRHRVKKTVEGEARPTQVALLDTAGEVIFTYDLPDTDAERDWIRGQFPLDLRKVDPTEDLSSFDIRHIKWRRVKKAEDPEIFATRHHSHFHVDPKNAKKWLVAIKAPVFFDGLRPGDTVAMSLGGSGDYLAFAGSRVADRLGEGTSFNRLPPFDLKSLRTRDKDEDAITLAELAVTSLNLFHPVTIREREQIHIQNLWSKLMWMMKDRIATGQRLRKATHDNSFINDDEEWIEGTLEMAYNEVIANDRVHAVQLEQEKELEKELMRRIVRIDVWTEIFKDVPGVAARIFARIFSHIGNVTRFVVRPDYSECTTIEECKKVYTRARRKSQSKFEKYCGLHVDALTAEESADEAYTLQGHFPRHSRGTNNRWTPELRQAAFLVAYQFNMQSDRTEWGRKLREIKARLRAKHPEPIQIVETTAAGKTYERWVYTDKWIHTTASWRVAKYFFRWFFWKWYALERRVQREAQGLPPEPTDTDELQASRVGSWRRRMERMLEERGHPVENVEDPERAAAK